MCWNIFEIFKLRAKKREEAANTRILFIHDGPEDRERTIQWLTDYGFQLREVKDSEEVIRLVREGGIDMVLADFDRPDGGAIELCRRLKADEKTRPVAFMLLTSRNTPKSVVDCYDAEADFYLGKPFRRRELIRQIQLTLFQNNPPVEALLKAEGRLHA